MSCNTILVIEDDKDIRDMLALSLEVEGYQVTRAANGKEGLEVLRTAPNPFLILLDLMMPVMNGWEFLQAMRKDDALAGIPVVLVSAFSDQIQNEDVQGIISKPIELDVLLKIIEKYCDAPPHEQTG
jgi:CheY-like chemotaxis protein